MKPLTDIQKQERALDKYHQELRKEHKIPGAVVPSSRTLKSHDIFTQRLLQDLQHDPLEALVELSRNAKSDYVKAQINLELLQYMIPKLKAVDTNPNQGETISINVMLPGSAQPLHAEIIKPGSLPPIYNKELEESKYEDVA